jgi:hypothetical protein
MFSRKIVAFQRKPTLICLLRFRAVYQKFGAALSLSKQFDLGRVAGEPNRVMQAHAAFELNFNLSRRL